MRHSRFDAVRTMLRTYWEEVVRLGAQAHCVHAEPPRSLRGGAALPGNSPSKPRLTFPADPGPGGL